MNEADLLPILARGKDGRHQFKRDETNADILANYRDLAAGRAFVSSGDFKADMAVLDRKEAEGW